MTAVGQPLGIDATGIGDDLHALGFDVLQVGADMDIDKVGQIARGRIGILHPAEYAHRPFGEIVEDQIIHPRHGQKLGHGDRAVDKRAGGSADADDFIGHWQTFL